MKHTCQEESELFEPGLRVTRWNWYPRKRRHSRWEWARGN